MDGDAQPGHIRKTDLCDYKEQMRQMRECLKNEPEDGTRPISSLAESAGRSMVKMAPDVEKLLFSDSCLNKEQIARYSLRGFDFRIPVRSDSEVDDDGVETKDFESLDFEGHVNVEVSQFFGNIFSVTYRFLFDGFTCKILQAEEDNLTAMGSSDRPSMEATTNHVIALLSSCLGAEYWTGGDEVDKGGIDLENRLILNDFWLDDDGKDISHKCKGIGARPLKANDRVFDHVLLCYKRYLIREFVMNPFKEKPLTDVSVVDDSRYAMVDIWENVRHPFGKHVCKDLFGEGFWPSLSEADVIDHIRDYHKPELVGLMSMYPAEWPYRAAEAYDEVCGENIAIDTDDLVLAGSHMTVVIGTYGRRGDGEKGVNWKEVMRDRRFYHVSWEEYLLIVQLILAKKYTFNHAVDTLLHLTEDMSDVTKKTIGICSKEALMASKKAIELDIIKHMKFPSHKVMYDRTARRLALEDDFQSFKDVQEVVSGNLQSLGEYQAAKADSLMNKALIVISVLSLLELAFQESKWPFVAELSDNDLLMWNGFAAMVSAVAAGLVGVIALYGIYYGIRKTVKFFRR